MVQLPPADPWDRQQGIHPVDEFQVACTWIPVNDDWAEVNATIVLHDGEYNLANPVQMRRVQRGKTVLPELLCLAWVKKMVGAGGVPVLGLHEDNPGHASLNNGTWMGRWWVTVGSRLSVAVVRLDGNLQGQVRLTLVE